jgi:hypothetical protein
MLSGCCGQPVPRRLAIRKEVEALPPNPKVTDGVPLLYLGSGRKELQGAESELTYVVSDHRRDFTAHAADVRALLRNRFVILRP